MTTSSESQAIDRADLLLALAFAQGCFDHWHQRGLIREAAYRAIRDNYTAMREKLEAGQPAGDDLQLRTADVCWSCKRAVESAAKACDECGAPVHVADATRLRFYVFLCHEINRFYKSGQLALAEVDGCLAEANQRIKALRRKLDGERIPLAVAAEASPVARAPAPPVQPRRNLMEILLDPRNIQMLLAFGGALMVVGLVILLWYHDVFKRYPKYAAVGLGVVNAAVLGAGWWLLRRTRHQMAGRAVTLLACLVLPLNLWYYHTHEIFTLDGHLWVAALVISVLYAASALVLRDELFVYVFAAGVTLTGLLILGTGEVRGLWEFARPATLLVVLGLLAIHAERAFPEQEGPFGRRRFGLAFFWSGHALLAAGLLLVLAADIAGLWLYDLVFHTLYEQMTPPQTPSQLVGEWRWLALLLVVAGTYAYVYSDLVVRRVGVYVYVAAATLLWALVLGLQMLGITLGMDALIAALALTALAVNAAQASVFRDSRYTRAFPVLGLLLPFLAVALGLLVYFQALSLNLKGVWEKNPPSWTYVGAMLLTALSCRFGAYLYRQRQPGLAAVYFFATAAATLVAATALLAALGLKTWQEHAPLLMLIPIAYLIAARLYRGRSEEQPLLWVSHAATAVMLAASLASAVEGFALVTGKTLNLALALFCAEAAVFYALATALYRKVWTIHLGAAMACGAVWQVLTYWDEPAEFYTLTFALVGLGLLLAYRFAVLERFSAGPLVDAAFQSANTLLSLSFVAALLLGLSRLATHDVNWKLVGLFAGLTAISLLSLALVRQAAWRRWYVVTTLGQAALTFLGMTVLSELSLWQKLEIFSVAIGLLLLAAGHVGWYREQEREDDMVSLGLLLGSLLVGLPLAIATLIDRSHDHWIALNEFGFLAAAVLLVTSGYLLQLKSTTLVGAALTALYFVTLLIYVPWSRLNAVAIFITVGGGTLFGTGLLLSLYRDRLLMLPERIKRREGMFRVLTWR
jgi:hypothetical protein